MPEEHDLAVIDRDGAIGEALADIPEMTRGTALRTALTAFGGATLLGGFAAKTASAAAFTPSKANDLKILQLALVFEHLGAEYYDTALEDGKLSTGARKYATLARRDERDHVRFVQAAIRSLGGKPNPKPTFDFGRVPLRTSSFLKTALAIEETCVETLNGAGPLVNTKAVLAGAGQLVSVEARQVTYIRILRGEQPIETSRIVDPGITAKTAVARARKLGFIKSFHPVLPS
jgi:hypothetical protein